MAEDSGATLSIESFHRPTTPLPPGPTGLSLLWSRIERLFDPLGVWTKCVHKYGDVVRLDHDTYLINHPDLIEQVLTDVDGFYISPYPGFEKYIDRFWGQGLLVNQSKTWRHQRHLIQAAFHNNCNALYCDVMGDYITHRLEIWHEGQTLALLPELMHLLFEMAAKVVLGLDQPAELADIETALQATFRMFDNPAQLEVIIPTRDKRHFHKTVNRLDKILFTLIRQRRASGQDRGDVLSKLLAAQDQDGQPLSDRQVRDEVVSLLRASHKNTATILVWTWYLLAQHPQAEARLAAELDQVLGHRRPEWADLAGLSYTESVIKETMRLYPLYPQLVREAVRDSEVGGCFVPVGTKVLASPWLMQRDPRYFDHPDRFDPDRWAGNLEKRLPNFVYIPFGGGPRSCAAQGYAMLEGLLLVAIIGQRFRLRPTSSRKVTPFPFYSGLRPKKDLQFVLVRR